MQKGCDAAMIRQEIRRVLLSPFFYISIAILFAGSFFPALYDISNHYDLSYLMDSTLAGYGTALMPILSTLAIADSYLIEEKDGYQYAVMARTTKLKYCLSKIGVAIGTGMAVVLITKVLLLLSMTVSFLVIFGKVVLGSEVVDSACAGTSYWIDHHNYIMFIGQQILYDCMYASIFPGLSLAVSTIAKNKYVVMLFPFIYANVTTLLFIGLQWYYLAPMILDAQGRASSLMFEGLPYRIFVILIYWLVSTVFFIRGVWSKMK